MEAVEDSPGENNMKTFIKIAGILLTIALLGAMIHLRALKNLHLKDQYHGSNFFTFWLSGYMVLKGENPYDQTQYLAGHDAFGVTWKPNKIFPYPLPLSLFMVPLGLLPFSKSYYLWQIISQIIIAITVFVLLEHWKEPAHSRLFAPLMVFFLFFVPVYLTLQVGSIGAFTLLVMLIFLLLFEKGRSLFAGIVLSLTILKPPQGLTILLLAGIWFLARKDWKAIQGVTYGGLAILISGMIEDPLWIVKFREASQAVMNRSLGIHSNVWSYSYLICSGSSPCATILGGMGALTLLGLGGYFLWRNHAQLSVWEAFNIIIPIGFVSTIYLWVYDQILYVIPIVWIVSTLVERKKSYIQAFIFLIVLGLVSLTATILHAYTLKDIWNLGTTIIVLGMVLQLHHLKQKYPIDKGMHEHKKYTIHHFFLLYCPPVIFLPRPRLLNRNQRR